MAQNNEKDWELIRQEMEIEAGARRIERRTYRNQVFLNLFPKRMRNKVLDIEMLLIGIPLIILCMYVVIRLAFFH